MKFDLSLIEMSKRDVIAGLKLPDLLTEELAEFIGIMVGDGHLGYYTGINGRGRNYVNYQIKIAGNKSENEYLWHIMNLFYSLFHIKLYYTKDTSYNSIILRRNSKGILQFLNKICGIPLNYKTNIVEIPEIIKKSEDGIKCAFLRGLTDTDFAVTFKNRANKGHNYPVIVGGFKSRKLVQDLENLFFILGFRHSVAYDLKYFDKRTHDYTIINRIYLYGRKNFERWINSIGFSNPKFQRKANKWLTEGVCPPGF